MVAILVVCTANICRSPVVEVLLKDRLAQAGLDDWKVSSAGTWAYEGQKAAEYSELLMSELGHDISNHRSRPIDQQLMVESDLILTMESGHAEALRAEFVKDAYKVHMLTEMAGLNHSVKDPYGGKREDYERMVSEVTQLIDDGMARIIELGTANEKLRVS
jgi:protein-tyrosine-phosphatase